MNTYTSQCCSKSASLRGDCTDRGHDECSSHHTAWYSCDDCGLPCDLIAPQFQLHIKLWTIFAFVCLMLVVAAAPFIMYSNMEHICTNAIVNVMAN